VGDKDPNPSKEADVFVQVIRGKVKDPAGLDKQVDRWQEEIKPISKGYLGSTQGVTGDGRFIVIARFESEEVARTNSDRPEQGKWWSETASYLDGEASFDDYSSAEESQGGGSDDAGFVQVIHGHSRDIDKMRSLGRDSEDALRTARPDVIGSLAAWKDDGTFTQIVYFTSEQEARKGESGGGEAYDQFQKAFGELVDSAEFYDLREPRLVSA
jgi:hypothetical protein